MRRLILGGAGALALAGAGLFVWQGYAQDAEREPAVGAPPPELESAVPAASSPKSSALSLPVAAPGAPRRGAPPPALPEATKESREVQRFNRYDRDRDNLISRVELLSTRTAAFKSLDRDGNNLLTFEEWAAATGEKFAKADRDRDRLLTRGEFATTAPKQAKRSSCRC